MGRNSHLSFSVSLAVSCPESPLLIHGSGISQGYGWPIHKIWVSISLVLSLLEFYPYFSVIVVSFVVQSFGFLGQEDGGVLAMIVACLHAKTIK